MAWYALHESSTGVLRGLTTVLPDQMPPGVVALNLGDAFPDESVVWDEQTQGFVARPAPVLVDRLNDLRTHPSFADFQNALNKLSAADRPKIIDAIGNLIGPLRYRRTDDDPSRIFEEQSP